LGFTFLRIGACNDLSRENEINVLARQSARRPRADSRSVGGRSVTLRGLTFEVRGPGRSGRCLPRIEAALAGDPERRPKDQMLLDVERVLDGGVS
jgi:hypothetical protein